MPKQPKVAEIFEYYPEGINLIGFPKVAVIDALGRRLGREVILERHQTEVRGRKFVYPSFPPEFAEKRQAFFRRLKSSNWVQRTFFDSGIPDIRDLGRYRTYEDFFGLCGQVYSTLKTARTQLRPFKHLPEAKRVLRRVDGFDSKLEEMLKTLEKIEESKTFALDVKNGEIAFIPEMPEDKISLAEGSRALGLGGGSP